MTDNVNHANPYFLTDHQYDSIKRIMKELFGLDGREFKKCIMDIARMAHANGTEQVTKAVEDTMAAHYPELGRPAIVMSLITKVGYYTKAQTLLYAQKAVDAYIANAGEPPRETALPATKEEFVDLFEATISEDPGAWPGETVYQVTKRELELLHAVLLKKA